MIAAGCNVDMSMCRHPRPPPTPAATTAGLQTMAAAGWHIQDGADAKGRRVIADRAYRAGDVVLEDDAAAWCLISEQLGAWCDCCLAPAAQPLRCSACKLAWYASREHQRRAWQAGAHRLECAALRSCVPHTPPTAVRLALRCVLRHWHARAPRAAGAGAAGLAGSGAAGAGEPADPDPSRYGEVLGLRHHWGDLQDAAKLECAQMGAAAHHLLQAAAPEAAEAVGPRELALLIARFGCNSHTIRCVGVAGSQPTSQPGGSSLPLCPLHAANSCWSTPYWSTPCMLSSHHAPCAFASPSPSPSSSLSLPSLSDDELQPLAVGIFPLGAMANHDCRPNTLHAFRGGRMVFRWGRGWTGKRLARGCSREQREGRMGHVQPCTLAIRWWLWLVQGGAGHPAGRGGHHLLHRAGGAAVGAARSAAAAPPVRY